jgi:hypothetical protein
MATARIAWVALGAAVLLAACADSPTAAPVPAGRVGDKWEYGELHYRHVPKRARGLPGGGKAVLPEQTTVRWVTAEGEVEATGWEDMAARLKAPALKKKAPAGADRLRVFNRLGADGWELAAYHPSERRTDTAVWTFKRKVSR